MVTAAEGKWQSKQSGKSEMEQKTSFFFIFRTTDNRHNKKKYKSADHSLAYRTHFVKQYFEVGDCCYTKEAV